MTNIFKLFLSSILISNVAVVATETVENIYFQQYDFKPSRPFYRNIAQNFKDYNANGNWKVGANKNQTSGSGTIFRWGDYADSWEEFKANYGSLDLTITMSIAFEDKSTVRWNTNSLNVPLGNIIGSSNWIKIAQVDEKTTQWNRGDMTHGKLSYACWVSDKDVMIRFYMEDWASNDYNDYHYSISTKQVACNTTFDYNKQIYSLLNQKVNNQTLNLESDYNSSLLEEHNKETSKKALDTLIQNVLGDYYEVWKQYIAPYSYDDKTNQATVNFKFKDPNTSKDVMWEFKVTIKYTLSEDYWKKELQNRLTIVPGKVINPKNPNGEMIKDTPLKWEGSDVYGTTATLRFDGAPDGSETLKINGVPIQVIDNTFTFEMTDGETVDDKGELVNQYQVLLEKHDLDDFNKIVATFDFNYVIKQDVPDLSLKWYAWNPDKNADQKKLIEPTLPDGSKNPNYDKEVNVETGTKKQIIWVKHQAQNPFPLDPLNKNGDIIDDGIYEQGFIAEGSVSGMGITQTFADSWIKTVERVQVDSRTLEPIAGTKEVIKSDDAGQYFSKSGTFLYTITDQKGFSSSKFIIIGQQWQDKYAKFLDVLNQPDKAVSFWSTLQGFHLKNYLAKYKQLNSKDIQELSFEKVSSYWKEYVSDVKTQKVGPGVNPDIQVDLNHVRLEDIKMNQDSLEGIKNEILFGPDGIDKQLSSYDLEYDVDYQIPNLDARVQELFDDYNSSGEALVKISVAALDTSTKAIGVTDSFRVRNSKAFDPDNLIDLSKIKFDSYSYNFQDFEVDKLRENYILNPIFKKFDQEAPELVYQTDYGVAPLDDEVLQEFINSKTLMTLVITIKAEIMSNLAKNSTTLMLINDPDGEIAPPEPPGPDPNPDPDGSNWISEPQNLIIMSVLVALVVATAGTVIFLRYRLKKGIGAKKSKSTIKSKELKKEDKKEVT